MGESKTKPTSASAAAFIARVPDPQRRADADALVQIFERASGEPAVMWGPSIVGFGAYHYKYESGREGDMCLVGFSPRSSALVLYARSGAKGEEARITALGKVKTGAGCVYVKRLADLDLAALEELVRASADHMRARWPTGGTPAKRAAAPKRAVAKKPAPKQRVASTKKPRPAARARRT